MKKTFGVFLLIVSGVSHAGSQFDSATLFGGSINPALVAAMGRRNVSRAESNLRTANYQLILARSRRDSLPANASPAQRTAADQAVTAAEQKVAQAQRELDLEKAQAVANQGNLNRNRGAVGARKDSGGSISPGMAIAVGALGIGAMAGMIGLAAASNRNPPASIAPQVTQLQSAVRAQSSAQQAQFDQINRNLDAYIARRRGGTAPTVPGTVASSVPAPSLGSQVLTLSPSSIPRLAY